jgi:hypothetical protein
MSAATEFTVELPMNVSGDEALLTMALRLKATVAT